MAHNYFHFEDGDDEDLMRLYNPSEYYRLNPYIPELSTPVVNIPEPVIPGGNQDNSGNPNADPFGMMDGTYDPNPNLLGQYVGYFDPAYDPAPGGTGSTFSNPDGTTGSLAPDDVQGYNGPMTPLGMSFEDATNAFNDDDDGTGFFGMNNMSFGDVFGLARSFSPTVMGMKTIGFMRDLVNNALNYESPDSAPVSAVSYNDVNAHGPNSANNVTGAEMAESYGNIAREMRDRDIGFGDNSGGVSEGTKESIGGCFIKGTMVEMADGTEKEITSISVGEETKGGTVQAKMEYMPHRIYDYKGVKVSGSHWVLEDGQFTEVENSKHGVLTDMIEPVYNFMTSKHRIFIKGVEFGGFYSQNPDHYEPYFKQEKIKINKELSEKNLINV